MGLLNRLVGRIFGHPPQSFALNDLDLKLVEAIGRRRNGFFIEAGANDGLSQTNTLYFERYLDWKGLLVEPIPELADKCRRNRPTAIVENVALVPFNYPASTVTMRYCNLMSLVEGGMHSQEEEDRHIISGSQVQQISSYRLEVRAAPLQSVLDAHGIREADLFVLDVEGFEEKVLQGIDHDRFVAHNLLIEARYREDVERALGNRYRPVAELSHHDILYRPVPISHSTAA